MAGAGAAGVAQGLPASKKGVNTSPAIASPTATEPLVDWLAASASVKPGDHECASAAGPEDQGLASIKGAKSSPAAASVAEAEPAARATDELVPLDGWKAVSASTGGVPGGGGGGGGGENGVGGKSSTRAA